MLENSVSGMSVQWIAPFARNPGNLSQQDAQQGGTSAVPED